MRAKSNAQGSSGSEAMRALIVDSCEGRGSLAAARALSLAGWTVGVGCPRPFGPLGLSRHVRHRHPLPPLADGAAGFVEAVARIVQEQRYQIVLPSSDGELLALSHGRDRLSGALPYPPHETVLEAIGKQGLTRIASRVGLRVPATAASAAEAQERWGARPLIVKEDRHGTFAADGRFVHIAPTRFEDLDAAERRVQAIRASGNLPVVQPLIEGRLMAFTSVIDGDGQLRARVQQVSERIYPHSAGLSVRAQTVRVDERLASLARELLRELRWLGLSEMQFILPAAGEGALLDGESRAGEQALLDGESRAGEQALLDGESRAGEQALLDGEGRVGEPALIDFNGRLYGSLALALAAGVNLPDIWGKVALGRELEHMRDARPGVRYHWLEGDLKAAHKSSNGRIGELADCVRYALRSHASIWRPTDPLPGIRVALGVGGQAIARRRTRRRAAVSP